MTQLWKIEDVGLERVSEIQLENEKQLEDWLEADPGMLDPNLMIIGRQVRTDFKGQIDLLGLDYQGNVVVIELKRDQSSRDVVAQLLDYASWVHSLSSRDIDQLGNEYFQRRQGKNSSLSAEFSSRFGFSPPDTLNQNHRMILVASKLDATSQRILQYLAEVHGLNINTAFFRVFDQGGQKLLSSDWLMDQKQVEDRSERKFQVPWTGLHYTNILEDGLRSWADCVKYGFLAAGYGRRYSGALDRLDIGDPIVTYFKLAGYVGYGIVVSLATMARDFKVDGKLLTSLPLDAKEFWHHKDDPENAEYVVGVDWKKTFLPDQAKSFTGAFSNQHIVCKLKDPATIRFLQKEFQFSLPESFGLVDPNGTSKASVG